MIAVKPPMQSWLMLLSGQKGVMIKGFYEKLSLLRPWKARPLPMLRKYDGSFARTQEEIASRWVEHVSSEMGGFPSSFEELAVSAATMLDAYTH